jgi:hypothetical protein
MHAYSGAISLRLFRFAARKLTKLNRAQQPMKRKQHRPSINYHLARLGKTLKD